jgi:hypothetical protein
MIIYSSDDVVNTFYDDMEEYEYSRYLNKDEYPYGRDSEFDYNDEMERLHELYD